jgi:hypothetical protein
MQKVWKRMKTPAGLGVAAALALVLAGMAVVAIAAPWDALLLGAGGLPLVGMALTADRETQYKEWPGIKAYPVKTGVFRGRSIICLIFERTQHRALQQVREARAANHRSVGHPGRLTAGLANQEERRSGKI